MKGLFRRGGVYALVIAHPLGESRQFRQVLLVEALAENRLVQKDVLVPLVPDRLIGLRLGAGALKGVQFRQLRLGGLRIRRGRRRHDLGAVGLLRQDEDRLLGESRRGGEERREGEGSEFLRSCGIPVEKPARRAFATFKTRILCQADYNPPRVRVAKK